MTERMEDLDGASKEDKITPLRPPPHLLDGEFDVSCPSIFTKHDLCSPLKSQLSKRSPPCHLLPQDVQCNQEITIEAAEAHEVSLSCQNRREKEQLKGRAIVRERELNARQSLKRKEVLRNGRERRSVMRSLEGFEAATKVAVGLSLEEAKEDEEGSLFVSDDEEEENKGTEKDIIDLSCLKTPQKSRLASYNDEQEIPNKRKPRCRNKPKTAVPRKSKKAPVRQKEKWVPFRRSPPPGAKEVKVVKKEGIPTEHMYLFKGYYGNKLRMEVNNVEEEVDGMDVLFGGA